MDYYLTIIVAKKVLNIYSGGLWETSVPPAARIFMFKVFPMFSR
jgi:hypothetical protein